MEHKHLFINKNKKGSGFVAWFFVIVVILSFSIFMLVINKAAPEINNNIANALENNMPNDSSVNVTKILDQSTSAERGMSNMLPFLIIGLFAFVMIGAGALLKHPIMIFIGIMVIAVLILIAAIFSNVYSTMVDSSSFTDVKQHVKIQSKFMDYLPSIAFIMAIAIFIAILYGKSGGAQGI